ncbi:prephenate dehydrogenase [Salinarchaeum sp. IM2453]|uniref:prephenate dehydrogenase n=1 Tax=Salinarchaeum sp. IM2453 TaxID=2862870 RepID=UPI001C83D9FC|nr:prephenate dehydrogenase [Salinarchaeum sp. IM2453]QZA88589.1 prephenate dehydrogenase [Salinarchaeum sp. IM2453]
MDTLIVGAGAMGRWFATHVPGSITFADIDQSAAHEAAATHDGEVLQQGTTEEQNYDLVCIAVPMSAVVETIETYGSYAQEAIVDITGVMELPLQSMEAVCPDIQRASFHPLFAPENAPGNIPTVIDREGPIISTVIEWFESQGNTIIPTTAEEHDTAMESIQAAAHTAVIAYGLAVDDVPDGYGTPISNTLDELVTQVTTGNPDVYLEIQEMFDGADRVAEMAQQIATADRETFVKLYHEATPAESNSVSQ